MFVDCGGNNVLRLVGCEIWRTQEGVASPNGKLYPFIPLSDCMKQCLEISTCVAVDISVLVCVVHTNVIDTAIKLNDSSFTQYTLNRACQSSASTSASSTSSTVSTEISTHSTYFGKCRSTYM